MLDRLARARMELAGQGDGLIRLSDRHFVVGRLGAAQRGAHHAVGEAHKRHPVQGRVFARDELEEALLDEAHHVEKVQQRDRLVLA